MALSPAVLPARYVHRQDSAGHRSRRQRDSRRQKQTGFGLGGRDSEPHNSIPQHQVDRPTEDLSSLEEQQAGRRAGHEGRLRLSGDDSPLSQEAYPPFFTAAPGDTARQFRLGSAQAS